MTDPAPFERTLTLSEERLAVSTRSVPVGTVRLERYQVTETRTITVDVVVDRVRVVRTSDGGDVQVVDDPPARALPAGTAPDASARWLVLSEEQVVVTKRTVPVERVQLATVIVVEDRTVTEEVRAERADLTTSARSEDVRD